MVQNFAVKTRWNFFFFAISASSAHLLQTTPHLENLDWLLIRFPLSGFRPPSMESVQTSHSLCPVAKFQKGIAKFSLPVNLCEEEILPFFSISSIPSWVVTAFLLKKI